MDHESLLPDDREQRLEHFARSMIEVFGDKAIEIVADQVAAASDSHRAVHASWSAVAAKVAELRGSSSAQG